MNSDLAPIDRAVRPAGDDQNPLLVLSAPWRKPVAAVLVCRAYLIREPLAFCTSLKVAIEQCGLEPEDGALILKKLCTPEFGMEHRFESDFMADFNRLAFHALARRRRLRDQATRREADRNPESVAGTVVRLADSFSPRSNPS